MEIGNLRGGFLDSALLAHPGEGFDRSLSGPWKPLLLSFVIQNFATESRNCLDFIRFV